MKPAAIDIIGIMTEIRTAGIIIIGDEILSGKVQDINIFFLARELWSGGITVSRIIIIPDVVDDIACAVREFSAKYDFVFTSGGIGPTHDDVTIEGVSRAFSVRTVINDVLKGLLQKRNKDLTPARLKMAEVPEGAELLDCGEHSFPLIKFRNVFVFPGIPEELRERFSAIRERFSGPKIFLRKVYLKEMESILAPHLNEIVGLKNMVKIGSYPVVNNSDYSVMITFESINEAELDSAVRLFLDRVPADKIIRVNKAD